MKINSIRSCVNFTEPQIKISYGRTNLSLQKSVDKMLFWPKDTITFTAKLQHSDAKLEEFAEFSVDEDNLSNELKLSNLARKGGVNTPKINKDGSYKIYGKNANVQINPIEKGHFKNVLDNILLMDKIGLYHGDLEQCHVFYSKDYKTEFDCFRFGFLFDEDPSRLSYEFPKNIYPSNAVQYENNCLGQYLASLSDDENKEYFLKQYLETSSGFHKNRAEFLQRTGKGSDKEIKYEKLQAELFKNPGKELVNLYMDRIDFQYKHRKMFTEWDEGFGACGHTPDESRTTNAVLMYFGVIQANIEYLKNIEKMKDTTSSPEVKEYLEYEKQYGEHWLKNHSQSIEGMSLWTLNSENTVNKSYKNVEDEEKQKLSDLFKEFNDTETYDDKADALQKCFEQYAAIIKKKA